MHETVAAVLAGAAALDTGAAAPTVAEAVSELEAGDDDQPWLLVNSFVNPHDIVFFGLYWAAPVPFGFGLPYPTPEEVPQIPPPDNGLGLRLLIARAIAEGHGGTLRLIDDGASSFCLRCSLPLA